MLKAVYLTAEEIPAAFRELYSEKNGQYELTGIEGIKTEADVERITEAYGKRIKDAAKTVKGSDQITAESVAAMVKEAISAAAPVHTDDGDIPAPIATRLQALERDLAAATEQASTFKSEAEKAKEQATTTILTSQLSQAAIASGLRPEAVQHFVDTHKRDFEVVEGQLRRKFIEGDPKTATQTVDDYLLAKKTDKATSYFWPGNAGSGSGGSGNGAGSAGGPNPFDPKNPNQTQQNLIYRQDPVRAKQLADSAGVDVLTGQPKKAEIPNYG